MSSYSELNSCAAPSKSLLKSWVGLAFMALGLSAFLSTAQAASGSAISSGFLHSCAVKTDGTVRCWGHNAQRQLGNGSVSSFSSLPTVVVADGSGNALSDVAAIAAGHSHSCALAANSTVQCWGSNSFGQLGSYAVTFSPTAVTVLKEGGAEPLDQVIAIAAGGDSTCAVIKDGTVRCWGRGDEGQLGDGNVNNSPYAVTVGGLTGVVAVDMGSAHACAVLADGSAKCWGRGSEGQLGNGGWTPNQALATTVRNPANTGPLTGLVAISTGDLHSCAVKADMSVSCWGRTYAGQRRSILTNYNLPINISGLAKVVALSSNGGRSFALVAGGTAKWWGYIAANSLTGDTLQQQPMPLDVKSETGKRAMAGIEALSVNASSACATKANATAVCWGNNRFGQLGDGTTAARSSPVLVRNESNSGNLASLGLPLAVNASMDSHQAAEWDASNNFNAGVFDTIWKPQNVTFANSIMNLTLKSCVDNCFGGGASAAYESGEYRSKAKPGNGRYVTRMKPAKGSGVVSSMFVYEPNLNSLGQPMYDKQDEIDIELLGRTDSYSKADGNPGGSCNGRMMLQINYYNDGVGNNEVRIPLSFDASAAYHTYAFDWQPTYIRWYVDGQVVWTYWQDSSGVVKGWGPAGFNAKCAAITTKNASTKLPDLPGSTMVNFWTGVNTLDITTWLGKLTYTSPLVTSYDSLTVARMPGQ